jgi:hypothetical protein
MEEIALPIAPRGTEDRSDLRADPRVTSVSMIALEPIAPMVIAAMGRCASSFPEPDR